MLRIAWFGEKVDQNFFLKILPSPPRIFFLRLLQGERLLQTKNQMTRMTTSILTDIQKKHPLVFLQNAEA